MKTSFRSCHTINLQILALIVKHIRHTIYDMFFWLEGDITHRYEMIIYIVNKSTCCCVRQPYVRMTIACGTSCCYCHLIV